MAPRPRRSQFELDRLFAAEVADARDRTGEPDRPAGFHGDGDAELDQIELGREREMSVPRPTPPFSTHLASPLKSLKSASGRVSKSFHFRLAMVMDMPAD